LLISLDILSEYAATLDEFKTVVAPDDIAEFVDLLLARCVEVQPETTLTVCKDQGDSKFLECAVDGEADYLVTRNLKHYPHRQYGRVKIRGPSALLRHLRLK